MTCKKNYPVKALRRECSNLYLICVLGYLYDLGVIVEDGSEEAESFV